MSLKHMTNRKHFIQSNVHLQNTLVYHKFKFVHAEIVLHYWKLAVLNANEK